MISMYMMMDDLNVHDDARSQVVPQTGNKGDRFPMSVWHRCDQSLAARAAASEPHHVCASGGLVNKHQPGGIKQALLSYPTSAGASDIGSLLLLRVQTFFKS
jgi:hypothetical protein